MPKSKIVKNLGFKVQHGPLDVDKLIKIIEDAYESYNEVVETKKKSFAPSKIGYGSGKCPRYWYIAFDGAEFDDPKDARAIANMKNGIASHDRLGELFKRSSLEIESIERKLEHNDPPIFGFVDIVINRAGERVVGEFKTTSADSFSRRQATMQAPDYHMIQLLIYMYVLEAYSGFFLYENKNTHEILIMPVYMTDENKELVENTFAWMRSIRSGWEERKLPLRPFTQKSKECKDCPVSKVCWSSEKYGDGDFDVEPLRLL
jgi:CRISPR/Cas system-associated exonuclease Cas4 (RecB family)